MFDWISAHTDTRPVIVPCDLADLTRESADTLAEQLRADYGRLDGLAHLASELGAKTLLEHYPEALWQRVMQVNLNAAVVLTGALLPLLRETTRLADGPKQTSIIFTSSSVGRAGRAWWGAYAASKFAVEGLMQTLADELAVEGRVRVNSVNPGATRTAMRQQAYPAENPADAPTPESRLPVFLHLLSDAAHGVSGQAFDARDWPVPAR